MRISKNIYLKEFKYNKNKKITLIFKKLINEKNEIISSLKRSTYIAATNNGERISSSLTERLKFPENFCG